MTEKSDSANAYRQPKFVRLPNSFQSGKPVETTSANNRQSYRIKPDEYADGAGIVFRNEVLPATLLDYSLQGCRLLLAHRVEIPVGEEIRVATSVGQFLGIVRRSRMTKPSESELAVEFTSTLDESIKVGRGSFVTAQSTSGSSNVALILLIGAALGILAYLLWDRIF